MNELKDRMKEREQDLLEIIEKIKKAPLQNDYIFKRTFTKSGTEEILKDFLEAILERKIIDVEVRNSEIPKEILDEKGSVLDIKAQIETKDKRMQICKYRNASKK